MIAALPLVTAALSTIGGSSAASTATSAVASAATRLAAPSLGASGAGDSFASLLSSFTQDTVGKMRGSEQMSVAGLTGKASTQSVVEAVMAAQESLQTALAVRDKAVSAFQDISRMPI